MTNGMQTEKRNPYHDGSNNRPCSQCGQPRGLWVTDYCKGQPVVVEPLATPRQITYLSRLISSDYSQATTYGLHKIRVGEMTKGEASRAIDDMLAG